MDQNTKNCIVFEIDDMFINFFVDNLKNFTSRMPSMIVDGTIQPYHACLPTHISDRVGLKNRKVV